MYLRFLTVVSLVISLSPAWGTPVRSVEQAGDVFVPGPKTAGAQDAWSLFHNPAGIAFVDGAQLVGGYAYQLKLNQDGVHLGQGGLAVNLFEGFSLGLGLQLGLPHIQDGPDKGSIGGSFGAAFRLGRALAFGARAFKHRQYALTESDPLGFSLGVEIFPFSWLSFGANFNQVYENFASYPEIHAGVALRPFTNKVSLGLESKFWPRSSGSNPDYAFYPEIGARIDLGAISLLASARANDIGTGFSSPVLFAGIDFNFDHIGLGVVAQGRPSDQMSIGGRFRLSSETWPSLVQKKNRLVTIELDQDGAMANLQLPFARRLFGPAPSSVETLWHLLELAGDESVSKVAFKFPRFTFRFARAEELRAALLSLKESGKTVHVHFDTANAESYLAASAADQITMSPAGEIELSGFRANLIFLHDMLEKLGIDVEAVTAGKYKNAPDMFTKSEPSKEELEVRNGILDQNLDTFSEALARRAKQGNSQIKEIIDRGFLTSTEAKDLGLVQDILYIDDVVEFDKQRMGRIRSPHQWSETPRIAVIPIKGMIVPGRVIPSLIGGLQNRTGAQDTIEALDSAVDDRHCVAIVLRIDSPGGDALASNLVYHAVKKARERKPIVASFADVAASGAYYIGSAANIIVAEPTTLTGSIGVFSLIPSGQALANKIGLRHFELKRSKNPGPSLFRPMTESERQRYQHLVDTEYHIFKSNVAESRHLSASTIDEIAQGRVWSGLASIKLGLVDQKGGFSDALRHARRLAGLDDQSPTTISLLGEPSRSLFALSLFSRSMLTFDAFTPFLTSAPMALSAFSYDFPSVLKETL